jgi:hypothetical protein|tara:strand:+ start:5499 stop:6065 length:567 start_codon:yes stop_codon:yes gene_type:complete
MNIGRAMMSGGKSLIVLAPFAIISIWFIFTLFSGPSPSGAITKFFITVVEVGELEQQGVTFSDIAKDLFTMAAWINIWSLTIVTIFALGWSFGSHYLNVDAPGKAKIYAIHWIIVSGILIGLILITNIYCLESTYFRASQEVTGSGGGKITLILTVYYTLAYYLSVLLGTARFVRSSVLLANKLPGNI